MIAQRSCSRILNSSARSRTAGENINEYDQRQQPVRLHWPDDSLICSNDSESAAPTALMLPEQKARYGILTTEEGYAH